ncbi:hypothetical protein K438DRAFT_1764071 [Mycena galopus ATCC 62051]|nr:hypothetical protein K438DRAFT_1764071 [Mycena galopus ATCC 62051]
MPRQPAVPEIRLQNITAQLTPILPLIDELIGTFGPPFVQAISNTVVALIDVVQKVKQNKSDCAELMENIHQILYSIIHLHIKSETIGSLPPAMMDHLGKFVETLRKIYTFVEAQQDGNRLKQLFRKNETNNLLKDCRIGLDHALEIKNLAVVFDDISEMENAATLMHNELLGLIQALPNASTISETSSVYLGVNELKNSSFSLLPPKPKIFHGRESELREVMDMITLQSPRIAILGGGGMGKTSLARAVLHHPDTATKFEHRFFVSAESATSSTELAALIGLHVGLNPGQDLRKAVVQYFSLKPTCLLILDNLETAWEPMQSRGGVEDFLSLLTAVDHIALMVCQQR